MEFGILINCNRACLNTKEVIDYDCKCLPLGPLYPGLPLPFPRVTLNQVMEGFHHLITNSTWIYFFTFYCFCFVYFFITKISSILLYIFLNIEIVCAYSKVFGRYRNIERNRAGKVTLVMRVNAEQFVLTITISMSVSLIDPAIRTIYILLYFSHLALYAEQIPIF